MFGYEKTQVDSMKMILSQIKVQGVEQARLLVMMDNIIRNGKEINSDNDEVQRKEDEH